MEVALNQNIVETATAFRRELMENRGLMGPKDDDGKLDWSVFPFEEAEEAVKVFESGAKKYGAPFTYRKGIAEERLFAAAMRHMVEIQKGNKLDHDSGLSHWAHVAANALMALAQRRME